MPAAPVTGARTAGPGLALLQRREALDRADVGPRSRVQLAVQPVERDRAPQQRQQREAPVAAAREQLRVQDRDAGIGVARLALLADAIAGQREVAARVLPGEAPIAPGQRVILWRYDDTAGSYLVTQDDAVTGRGDRQPAA